MIFDLQKATMTKRISAFILDFILLVVLASGFAFVLSAILGFDRHYNQLQNDYEIYENKYNVVFDITEDEYLNFSDAEKARYDDAYSALIADEKVVRNYNMVVNLSLIIVTFGIFFAYAILEFAIPLKLKNGQTIGKKIFGLGVMQTDGVRLTPVLLTIRTLLGKFTIETMVPVLIIVMIFFNSVGLTGTAILILLLVLQAGVLIGTRTNSCIHDLLAGTVVIDLPSQMIFDTKEDMIKYKEAYYAEKAAKQPY